MDLARIRDQPAHRALLARPLKRAGPASRVGGDGAVRAGTAVWRYFLSVMLFELSDAMPARSREKESTLTDCDFFSAL